MVAYLQERQKHVQVKCDPVISNAVSVPLSQLELPTFLHLPTPLQGPQYEHLHVTCNETSRLDAQATSADSSQRGLSDSTLYSRSKGSKTLLCCSAHQVQPACPCLHKIEKSLREIQRPVRLLPLTMSTINLSQKSLLQSKEPVCRLQHNPNISQSLHICVSKFSLEIKVKHQPSNFTKTTKAHLWFSSTICSLKSTRRKPQWIWSMKNIHHHWHHLWKSCCSCRPLTITRALLQHQCFLSHTSVSFSSPIETSMALPHSTQKIKSGHSLSETILGKSMIHLHIFNPKEPLCLLQSSTKALHQFFNICFQTQSKHQPSTSFKMTLQQLCMCFYHGSVLQLQTMPRTNTGLQKI
ncbi:hypothetical protein WMY93_010236 [Mugilogobius chulae]|uniref:Uncharacterized protein n=1 Tax=Mugilogobius chulae TaxID=88201 RepID=A0AAW0P6L9_9GOBI